MAASSRRRLVRSIQDLIEASADLRENLHHYERSMNKIAEHLQRGENAMTAANGTSIPSERRRVTEAIEDFEAARHQLRLALIVLGREEGASLTEIGHALGISRQLASRLAGETG